MRRVLRVTGLGLAGLVALVATVYVVHGLGGLREVEAAKRRAVVDLADGLATTGQESSAEVVRRTTARFGSPTYSWQEVVCELTTRDAGWMVDDYVQECSLRSVSLVETRHDSTDCQLLEASQAEPDPPTTVVVWRGPAAALESTDYVSGCPSDVLTPGFRAASRLLDGDRPSSLSSNHTWVVVEAKTSLSSTLLGCSPWGVLFCSAPVDGPVLDG